MQNKTDDDHKITVSFGKSPSKYYSEAVEKAKLYSTYHMSEGKHVITLPIYKLDIIEQVKNLSGLLGLIMNWKSASLEIDGEDLEIGRAGMALFCCESYCYEIDDEIKCSYDDDFGCTYSADWSGDYCWFKEGELRPDGIFYVNKDKIEHNIRKNLERAKICPALDIDDVLQQVQNLLQNLPDTINTKEDSDLKIDHKWKLRLKEAITIKEKEMRLTLKRNRRNMILENFKEELEKIRSREDNDIDPNIVEKLTESESGKRRYKVVIRQYNKYLKDNSLTANESSLQLFIDSIKDKYADSTLRSKKIALQNVLRRNVKLEEMPERNLENLYLIYLCLIDCFSEERERRIIELRYGLKDGKRYTLKEIGNKIDLSGSSVGQIRTKAVSHVIRRLYLIVSKSEEAVRKTIESNVTTLDQLVGLYFDEKYREKVVKIINKYEINSEDMFSEDMFKCYQEIQKVQRTKEEGCVPFPLDWLISLNWLTKDKIGDICKKECRRKNLLKLDMINQLRHRFRKDINLFKPDLDPIQHKILSQLLRKYLERGRKIKVEDNTTGSIISDEVAEEYSEIEKELEEYLKTPNPFERIFKEEYIEESEEESM